ncbi:MAG: hypothetical protein U0350_21625 [Caldilineaceae bacterium]
MIWKYYIPHLWEQEREVWEDIYLLPDDAAYTGDAIWLTVDALGFYEAEERRAAEEKLGGAAYWIEGADMLVATEDFTRAELLDWLQLWFEQHDIPLTELVESDYSAFQGRVPDLDAAFAAVRGETDTVQVDPDSFTELSPVAETGHKYKIMMSKELLAQIEAMDEYEAEGLMRAIAGLADNPVPADAKRLSADPADSEAEDE